MQTSAALQILVWLTAGLYAVTLHAYAHHTRLCFSDVDMLASRSTVRLRPVPFCGCKAGLIICLVSPCRSLTKFAAVARLSAAPGDRRRVVPIKNLKLGNTTAARCLSSLCRLSTGSSSSGNDTQFAIVAFIASPGGRHGSSTPVQG